MEYLYNIVVFSNEKRYGVIYIIKWLINFECEVKEYRLRFIVWFYIYDFLKIIKEIKIISSC